MATTFTKTSLIPAPSEQVWRRIVTPEGINDELFPYLRMTVPAGLASKPISEISVGQPLGRSWFFLFGVLPFDYDDITIAELELGRRFVERSTMGSMRHWQHERTLSPTDSGCEVTDRIEFELRSPARWIPGMQSLVLSALRFLFNHRHRRLRRSIATSQQRDADR